MIAPIQLQLLISALPFAAPINPPAGGERSGHFQIHDEGMADLAAPRRCGLADVTEQTRVITLVAVEVHSHRIALPVERAAEVVVRAARHARDGVLQRTDIVVQFHCLAAEAVVGGVVLQRIAEHAPAHSTPDGVRVVAVVGKVGRGQGHVVGDIDVVAAVDVGAVYERLAVLDVHRAAVAGNRNKIIGFRPAEGDDTPVSVDAPSGAAGGGHLAAVDGNVVGDSMSGMDAGD